MPYNPTVNDISGQIYGQSMANLGNMFFQAGQMWKQKKDEADELNGKNKAFESLLKTHATDYGVSKEQMDAMLARDPNETEKQRYARLSGYVENAAIGNKMKQFSQQQKAYEQQQAAGQKLADLGRYAQGQGIGVYDMPTQKAMQAQLADPMTQAAIKMQQLTGATPSADDIIKMQAASAKPTKAMQIGNVGFMKDGKPWQRSVNELTGEVLGERALQDQPEVPNPLNVKIFESMDDERKNFVQPAVSSLRAYDEIDKVLNAKDSGIISGAFANPKLAFSKIGKALGMENKDIENTELVKSQIAIPVASIIKNFGSGTGLSDADREFALRAAGGEITLEPESIKRLIAIGKKASKTVIDNYNARLDETYPDSSENAADKKAKSSLRVRGYSGTTSQPTVKLPAGWSIK